MDEIDLKLVQYLQAEGRLTLAELAVRVGLSGPAVGERVRKLEQQGIIRGYAARVDPGALGYRLTAFVEVSIQHPRYNDGFLAYVTALPEVQECHHVTGSFSYLLKVRCRDTSHLERLLTHRIKAQAGVERTRTTVVLSTQKEDGPLPADQAG